VEKLKAVVSSSTLRRLMAKHGTELKTGWHSAVFDRHTRIRGGSMETDEKELAVKPQDFPFESLAVTMTSPLGKRLMASLKLAASTLMVDRLEPDNDKIGHVHLRD
jgi:hypothetical protein